MSSSCRDAHCSGGLSGGREIISVRLASVVRPRNRSHTATPCSAAPKRGRPHGATEKIERGRAILQRARARSYIRYLILECPAPTLRSEDPERLPLTSDSARGQDVPSSPQDCVMLCPQAIFSTPQAKNSAVVPPPWNDDEATPTYGDMGSIVPFVDLPPSLPPKSLGVRFAWSDRLHIEDSSVRGRSVAAVSFQKRAKA